ncbi:MAG: bifunctional oligoribonuclease/PAP phosphatase NrnA [candidate division Zixibacteria bacterium]|nr:bifunctional oligoribonuclease/PAP phosphatase NrnA [candidate division Zixibacteria bacterium]
MKEKFDQISESVKTARRILITSHLDPDGDSIGSQLALRNWLRDSGKEVKIINQGKIPSKYLFLDEERAIEDFNSAKDINWSADLIFVLECPNLERIGEVKKLLKEGAKVINLDHHPDNSFFGDISYVDTQACALGEIIYELLIYSGYRLNKLTASQLYAAILTDTGRFRFSNTTPEALRIGAELITLGANPKEINNQIYYNNSNASLKLLGFLLLNLETFANGKISFLVIDQATLKELNVSKEDTEGFVDYSLFLKGAEVGVLFTQKNDSKTKVSLRSQNSFDVSALARTFGGGGHRNAAGCTVNQDLNSTKELILKKIEEQLSR